MHVQSLIFTPVTYGPRKLLSLNDAIRKRVMRSSFGFETFQRVMSTETIIEEIKEDIVSDSTSKDGNVEPMDTADMNGENQEKENIQETNGKNLNPV